MTTEHKDADLIIMNTCSVREKAEQKFFSDLGRFKTMKKENPHKRIAVAGCIAQQMGQDVIKRAPHVDMVIGPANYHMLAKMLREAGKKPGEGAQKVAVGENPDLASMELPMARSEGARAWISIMYGCNNFCTYCIVPYTRGREKSRPSASIIKEAKVLASQGYRELTLLGQNVNSYNGGRTDFPDLLEALDAIDGIERIRFVTSHPRDLSHKLISAISSLDSVCEHLHLPLQSGSSKVLGAMNRKYNYAEYKDKIDMLRLAVPGIALTTDIIAGFPGESDEDHELSLRALEEIGYDGIFAFRYSERPGTKAALMEGGLPEGVRLARLKEILDLQEDITLKKNLSLEGKVLEVLVEGMSASDSAMLSGRTRTNKIVNFYLDRPDGPDVSNGEIGTGSMVKILIKQAHKHSLSGQYLGETCG